MSLTTFNYKTSQGVFHAVPDHGSLEYILVEDTRGVFWTLYEENENPYDSDYGVLEEAWEEGPFPTAEEATKDLANYIADSPRYNP